MSEWETLILIACYIAVFAGLSLFGAHRLRILWSFWRNRHRAHGYARRFETLPRVTVQLPLFNEYDVVEGLLKSVGELDYPRELLQIQVLDDSTDETVAECRRHVKRLQSRGFDVEYRHRTDRGGFKAGALDAGMASAKGEFIAIFDADFRPKPDYLQRMIHHFTDPKVGMVQARWGHANREFSTLTRLQALFLDGHLVLEQTARSRDGDFLNFNGTAGVWRKQAIVDGGGWQHDTLTEDLDLSYRTQLKGWKFLYLPDVVVPAELPPDMDGFKTQQHRWTKGSVQVCKKMLAKVWKSEQPLGRKVEATAHLTSNFAYLLTLGVLVLMYPANFVIGSPWAKAVFVDLPVFFLAFVSVVAFYLAAQGAQTRWGWLKALPYLPLLLALGIGMSINNGRAVIEALFNQKSDFVRTPKYGVKTRGEARGKPARYKAGKSIGLWIEVVLAGYFGLLLWMAIDRGQWGSLPFLTLFFGGFAYVAAGSLAKRFSVGSLLPKTPPPPAAPGEEGGVVAA
jgi:cellulose synthase/poly-beta-1,6-N-acetylglucosamine synthase-like glycosyltransferase